MLMLYNHIKRAKSMGKIPVLLRFLVPVLCLLTGGFHDVIAQLVTCLESDQEALINFKNGLEDPENRLSSWQGSNCCHWRGIVCENSTGAVIAVDLHNPYPFDSGYSGRYGFWNLSGVIRSSLVKLKSLAYLDLSLNTFQGISVPEFFGSLKNLRYLNLSNAGFVGAIPPHLGNLSNLQYLDVQYSGLVVDSLEWMTGLVSLKYLAMNRVDLSMIGPNWVWTLNKLPFMTELYLSSCGLSGYNPSLTSLNLTSLAIIDLGGNSFKSKIPNWLVNITSVKYLDISDSGFYGSIPLGFSDLPNLQVLKLDGNGNITASCSQLFRGRWEKIEVFSSASNKLHGRLPSSFGNMTSLIFFDLFLNQIEGGIPSSIGKMCSLNFIRLTGNNMTGSLPEFLEGTENCLSTIPLPNLQYLYLSNNQLIGTMPEWLGQVKNLVELGLEYNMLKGPIPTSLGSLQNLTDLGLTGNKLTGSLPDSLGQLSALSTLDVSFNHLTGTVSEAHFSKLSKLKFLHLSSNSFTLNVSSSWIPPFQVRNLDMGTCSLGPSFPIWLKSQKEVKYLDFSNASISGSIPNWFWEISSNLSLLNISHNQLHGQIPNPLHVSPFADIDFSFNLFQGTIPLTSFGIELLDLSHNHLSGPIPWNIGENMPDLIFLVLSSNQLSGEIPSSIGEMLSLQVIDLSSNNLTGSIPSSFANCSYLKALDLGSNRLSGVIPDSLAQLQQVQSVHLSYNQLLGKFPSSFRNLSSLETLDLGINKLSGKIPPWIGNSFPSIRILSLRSNAFSGEIPSEISKLSTLQVLDLAGNNLSGSIPGSFGNLSAMTLEKITNQYLYYGKYRGRYYEESLVVNTKGQFPKYTKILSLVTIIDLSGNNLYGNISEEITKLLGLVVLNLSKNHITGHIPRSISNMHQLESLDLSSNRLSGTIPSSMSSLTFLGYLNLSHNNFMGTIPYTDHMSTFDASSFAGNPGLCGPPLSVQCPGDDSTQGSDKRGTDEVEDDNKFIDKWFYLSLGLGFAAGILIPHLILAFNKSWSDAYFVFVDKVIENLPWSRQQRTIHHRNRHRQRK
ncbi:LRR receptor-like kinase family protein [Quillaja saponaria]|uniref:LRR receptor-like kinase family protein n=1 Tax=Quillaja saponaria TaxID=32244 RepID=A0AAD7PBX7_QUISA|nr:LRR receptor-like kinase family protein [Quillaja saponaria]